MSAQLHPSAPFNTRMLASAGAGLGVMLVLVLWALGTRGHASFNTADDGVTWGLPVATYVFFVLTSTGLTFVASLAMVFGLKGFYPIAKRCIWLAAATLIAGFAALAFELGHPFRMLWAIPLGMQFKSPMNWMGAFYTLYLAFLLLKFQRINAGDWHSGASRRLGVLSFATVIVAHGTLGLVFGMMAMRPFWYDGLIPLYFLASAFLSGVAFATLFTHLAYGFDVARMPPAVRALLDGALSKLFALALGVMLLFVVFRTVTGLWSNAEGLQAFEAMVASPWFHLEVWVGLALPFALLLSAPLRARPAVQVLASALVIAALAIGRYEFVIGGQMVPMFQGAWVGELVQYTPSLTEGMLGLMAVFLALALYALGERLFGLDASPRGG